MKTLPQDLDDVFEAFEGPDRRFSEWDVASAISAWRGQKGTLRPEVDFAARAEVIAFQLRACEEAHESSWGTYFGPMMSFTGPEGERNDIPALSQFTKEVLQYWTGRCSEARHPILSARYADLLWDLHRMVTGGPAHHGFARAAIRAYVEASDGDLWASGVDAVRGLRRALALALCLNDPLLVGHVRDSILRAFRRYAEPGALGVWAALFDTVYDNKKVALSEAHGEELIDRVELVLAKSCTAEAAGSLGQFEGKAAATRLANHYRRVGRLGDVLRVMRVWGGAVERLGDQAHPALGMAWLRDLHAEYLKAGMNADAVRVQLSLKAKGALAAENMPRLSAEVSLSNEQVEEYLAAMTEGGLEGSLRRIAFRFALKKGDASKQLEETAREHPLLVRMPRALVADGHVVAEVGPLDEDPEGHVTLELAQQAAVRSLLLVLSLDRVRETYKPTAADMADHIFECPLFDPQRRGLVERGLDAWLKGDHVTAVHVLMPQLEQALRGLLQAIGIPTDKRGRWGGMQEKNMWDVLTEPLLARSALAEYLPYLRTVLVDPRGLNLRNRLCHGLLGPEEFRPDSCALVLHALLLVAQLRIAEQPPQPAAT